MITSIQLTKEMRGLKPFKPISLSNVVLLVGKNGAGKSRLLNLLAEYNIEDKLNSAQKDFNIEFHSDKKSHKVINYSHYDALLQSPDKFIYDVISSAKDRLKKCNYEITAMDALLYIYDMAFGYSQCFREGESNTGDFKKFVELAKEFEITIEKDGNRLLICGLDINSELLSPGQRYLLRMAVVCFRNQQDRDKKFIFLLDEPEVHLHPDILIATVNRFVEHFGDRSQFFIATHSLALLSHFVAYNNATTILWLHNGKTERFRSNTTDLINGLIGSEENRLAINNLISLPDDYACNLFASQCCESPQAVSASAEDDPSSMLASATLDEEFIVLDYGVGKGRFIESLSYSEKGKEILSNISEYYAYDKYNVDEKICKRVMRNAFRRTPGYSVDEHYFNDLDSCKKALGNSKANVVLMINVLHEIDVKEWISTFQNIKDLLENDGHLVIVEREELTIGETPYVNGYVMLTEEGEKVLFSSSEVKRFEKEHSESKSPIIRYTINRREIEEIDSTKIKNCLKAMKNEAKNKIQSIHKKYREDKSNNCIDTKNIRAHKLDNARFKDGIRLAFWVHQYANVSFKLSEL